MLIEGEINSKDLIDNIFSSLENQLLDKTEINLNFQDVTFISVYFLERLEQLVQKSKELNVKITVINIPPSIYKVFQVARVKNILELCV